MSVKFLAISEEVKNTILIFGAILLVAIIIGVTIFLVKKFVPHFKEHKNEETDSKISKEEEIAKENVEEIVSTSSSLISEQMSLFDEYLNNINRKAKLYNVQLDEEDFSFLLIQEKINDLDKSLKSKLF